MLAAYDFWETGQLAEWWGADPPYWAVLGVRHYHRALERVRLDAIKNPPKRSAAPSPVLPGSVVSQQVKR